jgi:hypothetical protein
MDRPNYSLVATCGLALILAGTGCRSTRSDVPPGRQYTNDGRQVPGVSFSSDPHPAAGGGFSPNAPGMAAGTSSPFGAGSGMMNPGGQSGGFGPPVTGSLMPGSPASMGIQGGPNTVPQGYGAAGSGTSETSEYTRGAMQLSVGNATPSSQSSGSPSSSPPERTLTPAESWPPPQ